MILPNPLIEGTLLRRYKRFLADIKLPGGELITAHCPNSGSMKGCNLPGSPVLISKSNNPKRKLTHTWELVRVDKYWVGINTMHPNALVNEAINRGVIQELSGYSTIKPEVPYSQNSRIDLLLERESEKCYVEVKNVTLLEGEAACFPDAVTLRGQRHLRDLMQMVKEGHRSVIVFVVNRDDAREFRPADDIDPEYGKLLREAAKAGVEILAYQSEINPPQMVLKRSLPVQI